MIAPCSSTRNEIFSKSGNKVNFSFYPAAATEDTAYDLRPAASMERKKPDAIMLVPMS